MSTIHNTTPNGGQILTDERINELRTLLTAAGNASFDCGAHNSDDDDNPDVVPYEELARIAQEKRESVVDFFRASRAAVPASEPVAVRDLLLEMGDGVAGAHLRTFGKCINRERWGHIADSVLAARVPVFTAAPAPVSGMPDLAPEECTLCNGMGMLDGSGAICPHCNGDGKEPVAATLPAAPAPTEQAELKNIATNHDAMIILTQDYTREQKIRAVDAHMRRELTALAARQAPTSVPKLDYDLLKLTLEQTQERLRQAEEAIAKRDATALCVAQCAGEFARDAARQAPTEAPKGGR